MGTTGQTAPSSTIWPGFAKPQHFFTQRPVQRHQSLTRQLQTAAIPTSQEPEDEVQIIQEDPYFEKNKAILEKELEDIENGKSKCISMEELDLVMEKIITKYEN